MVPVNALTLGHTLFNSADEEAFTATMAHHTESMELV
jgi:hypothetical protein